MADINLHSIARKHGYGLDEKGSKPSLMSHKDGHSISLNPHGGNLGDTWVHTDKKGTKKGGKGTESLSNHLSNLHGNSQHAEDRGDSHEELKSSPYLKHTEVTKFAPPALGVIGPTVQFREEPNQQFSEEQDEDKHHQHVMNRLGYKHYKGGSYFHGPSNGAKNVMKDAKSGSYQFLNGHNHNHDKWGMSKKELYEHMDKVHGGFKSLTLMSPHEAANKSSQHNEQFAEPGKIHSALKKHGWVQNKLGPDNYLEDHHEGMPALTQYLHPKHDLHVISVNEKERKWNHNHNFSDKASGTHENIDQHLQNFHKKG